jgi:predicted enzyme related to lactoylglutathione lyase
VANVLITIDVGDLERAVEFYTAAVGLRHMRRLGPDIAELHGDAAVVFLTQHRAGSLPYENAATARDYRRHWTPVHLDFVVSDLRGAVERAEAAGATREGDEPREFPGGRFVVLSDPFGNGFCLLQFEGEGYDELAERAG